MPRRTQGECGSRSRRPGRRFSRDEDAASRTRQWPIPGLWEWRRARSASAIAAVWSTKRTWLASAERQLVRSEASCVLCSLIRFSAWPRAIEAVIDPLGRADVETGDDE